MRSRRHLRGLALLLSAWALAPGAPASAHPMADPARLEVPFLSQSEALCGGAAAAMVLRYWGARGITSEDFAPLLNARGDGIESRALVADLDARGWRAHAFSGSLSSLSHHLSRGRPVIALIEVRPARYHFVVVVQVTGVEVVYHDPAARPSEQMARAEFEQAWAGSGRTALLVLPREESAASPPAPSRPLAPPPACAGQVAAAAEAAAASRFAAAEDALTRAQARCPEASAPLRELASLRLIERRFDEAAVLARDAVRIDASDAHAWRVLGTAEFLRRNTAAALRAWNRTGEPTIDLVTVEGLRRTRHRVVTDYLGLESGVRATPERIERARRRLEALPSAAGARLDVAPVGGGLTEVDAAVLERRLTPTAPLELAARGARAAVTRQAEWHIASPTGRGERVDLLARWWEGRPAAGVGLAMPVRVSRIGGILTLAGTTARESFASVADRSGVDVEAWRSASMSLSDWTARGLGWRGGVRLDRFGDGPWLVGIDGSIEQRVLDNTAAWRAAASTWPSAGFSVASLDVRWRLRRGGADRLLASAGASLAGEGAPRVLWNGAGTGHGRAPLLRAHPLLDGEGVIAGVFGRQLAYATIEARRALWSMGPLRLQAATFLDTAAVSGGPRRGLHLDAGLGLRFDVPGEGTVRVDYARSLHGRSSAVSVGWEMPWPTWP